jgi:hypothetical protein
MKSKIKISSNLFLSAIVIATGFSFAFMMSGKNSIQTAQKFSTTQLGLGTCFQRLTQSFTAAMIGDFSSTYLTKDFSNVTGECFGQVNSILKSALKADQNILSTVNDMTNESHWFYEKLAKIKTIAGTEKLNMNESSLIDKFSKVESYKMEVSKYLERAVAFANESSKFSYNVSFTLLLTIGIFAAMFLIQKRRERNAKKKLEIESLQLLQNNLFTESRIDRHLEQVFINADYPHTLRLFSTYHGKVLEGKSSFVMSAHSDISGEESSQQNRQNLQTTDINDLFNASIDMVQSKAFSQGIIFDYDIDNNIHVLGEREGLMQLTYHLLAYGLDVAGKLNNDSKKIQVRSKVLGQQCYTKLFIPNHFLTATELEALGDSETESQLNDMNLMLIIELTKDLNVKIEVGNTLGKNGKMAGAKIELLFNLAEQSSANDSAPKHIQRIVKGSKSEVLSQL